MVNLQFPLVETLWKSYWRFSEGQTSDTDTLDLWELLTYTHILTSHTVTSVVMLSCVSLTSLYSHDESEKRLPKSVLVLLCKYEPVLNWTRECDNLLYQSLVEILIPDVLRPIPSELHNSTQTLYKLHPTVLQNFTKCYAHYIINILCEIHNPTQCYTNSVSTLVQWVKFFTIPNKHPQ